MTHNKFSKRIKSLSSSSIRELFKMMADPEFISLAGGAPDPKTIPKDDEVLDLVNESDEIIGKVKRSDIDKRDGVIVRTVGSIIIDNQNNILLQQRSRRKKNHPLAWNSLACTGHVESGETPEASAKRELKEELNLDLELTFFKKEFLPNIENHSMFRYIYYSIAARKLDIDYDQNEIETVKWIDIESLINDCSDYGLDNRKIDDLKELLKVISI